jgi:hypothetical protein
MISVFTPENFSKSSADVICAFLEPAPPSWFRNREFPNLGVSLMGWITRHTRASEEMVLLSFDVGRSDEAYVVDQRGILEWESHNTNTEFDMEDPSSAAKTKTMIDTFKAYWNSMVPVQQYRGEYSVPEVVIFSPIASDRLKVELKTSARDLINFARAERIACATSSPSLSQKTRHS